MNQCWTKWYAACSPWPTRTESFCLGRPQPGGWRRTAISINLLIVERIEENRHRESVAITDVIGDVRYPIDVKIISTDRFEATKNIIGGIAYPAHKYGRRLYQAA